MRFEHGLKPGQIIDNNELRRIFKCGPQGGMRRSLRTNSLVIVSNHTRSIYEDRWIDDVFHYTGMGLTGDQSLDFMQNKTVAQSRTNGVNLFLFEVFHRGNYFFIGQVELAQEPYQEQQPGEDEVLRQVWIFPLKIIGNGKAPSIPFDTIEQKQRKLTLEAKRLSDDDLFNRSRLSRKGVGKRHIQTETYERNIYVAESAKRLADGTCQLCREPAPFSDKNGDPFLETHHIRWLSRGGEDTIENTIALCPNCHRRMHILDLISEVNKLKAAATALTYIPR